MSLLLSPRARWFAQCAGSALLSIVAWWKKTRPCIPSRNERQRRAMAVFPQRLIRFVHAVWLSLLVSLTPLACVVYGRGDPASIALDIHLENR